jgi:hypothetical protein
MAGKHLKRTALVVAVAAALAVPAQVAAAPAASESGLLTAQAAAGPTATKAGVLINYSNTGKLRIGKKIAITLVCSANCNVQTTTVVKGPKFKDSFDVSGPLTAGVPGGPFFEPNGPLLKQMKDTPGRFRVNSTATATDPATGAVETISRGFRLKR